MRHLRNILHQLKNDSWSDAIPLVRRIMNATPVETLGVSPARIIFGSSLELDRGIVLQGQNVSDPLEIDNPSVKVWLDKALAMQKKIFKYAQLQLFNRDMVHLGERDPGTISEFPIDSFVLLQYPSALGGDNRPPTKLHMRWQGPYRVVEIKPGHKQYVLQDLVTLKNSIHNVMDLKRFQWDSEFVNPIDVAVANKGEFHIERILNHRGNWKKVSTLEFLVRWTGYDESHDLWLPWKELRLTEQLHNYLRLQGQESKIPR
jgi:hypothetical protein